MSENPYLGVNAHLNSFLQTPGTRSNPSLWGSFHAQHISEIVRTLNAQLPAGYIALAETSLQMFLVDDILGSIQSRSAQPDVTVFQQPKRSSPSASAAQDIEPTWEADMLAVLDLAEEDLPVAVVIHTIQPPKLGQVVARMELLSPANKRGGSDYYAYIRKRAEALQAGTPLIEIDYLHEKPSVVSGFPIYLRDPQAYPYNIIVSDPRHGIEKGRVRAYGSSVGETIHRFPIPLTGDVEHIFDLTPVYHETYRVGRWGEFIDYSVEPDRFETYSPADQAQIRAIMTAIQNKN